MENQTRFDLNEALTKWRTEELASQGGVSAEAARELESHLRDSVAELQSKGLSEKEAFWLARRRLGSAEKIAAEFVKGDPARLWTERVFWMVAGVLAMHILSMTTMVPLMVALQSKSGRLSIELIIGSQVAMYAGIIWLALFVARGRLPKFIQAVSNLLKSPRRLFIVAIVVAGLHTYPLWTRIWNTFTGKGSLYKTGILADWGMDFLRIIWPLVICCILVYLWRKLSVHTRTQTIRR